ncbi:uncharacterized protein LOC112270727 [Brachypodium distachyon]|uniref:uncharacterized protein LOC112270727 n=1 Tax=Brachypodium distachyon TaxID=15368 RepID=UPI00052FE754|nr:uncharacterized protein LOC112270727 [Brachypodium distachyon]|eukprot:XP_024314560.1 uncharacterized protein LOC112270727 [Brachypodium distachyon]
MPDVPAVEAGAGRSALLVALLAPLLDTLQDVAILCVMGGLPWNTLTNQRHKLKQKWFDPMPLSEVSRISPMKSMSNKEWCDLVDSWITPKKPDTCAKNKVSRSMVKYQQATGSRSYEVQVQEVFLSEKYKDKPPDAVDLFKETHFSTKRGFSENAQAAIDSMENFITREPKSAAEVISDVLNESTKNNRFLERIGLPPIPSSRTSKSSLLEKLEAERDGNAELRSTIEELKKAYEEAKVAQEEARKAKEEADAARVKNEEEIQAMKKKLEADEALLRQVMRRLQAQ